MADRKRLVKVIFDLSDDPEQRSHGSQAELVWAKPLGDGKFEILNSPFYASGVSFEDIVSATPDPDDGDWLFRFDKVTKSSGSTTVRIIFSKANWQDSESGLIKSLNDLGCFYEGSTEHDRLVALDIPEEADYAKVKRLLDDGEIAGTMDYEESALRH